MFLGGTSRIHASFGDEQIIVQPRCEIPRTVESASSLPARRQDRARMLEA